MFSLKNSAGKGLSHVHIARIVMYPKWDLPGNQAGL